MAGSIKDLSKYRYEKSVEQIKVAETLINNEIYRNHHKDAAR